MLKGFEIITVDLYWLPGVLIDNTEIHTCIQLMNTIMIYQVEPFD